MTENNIVINEQKAAERRSATPELSELRWVDSREQARQAALRTDQRRHELGLDSDRALPSANELAEATRL